MRSRCGAWSEALCLIHVFHVRAAALHRGDAPLEAARVVRLVDGTESLRLGGRALQRAVGERAAGAVADEVEVKGEVEREEAGAEAKEGEEAGVGRGGR